MSGRTRRWLEAVGRLAMAGIFFKAGWEAFQDPGPRVGKAEAFGLPEPELMVKANGAAMAVGGAALAANVLPRAAGAGLIASLIPTTLAGHAFWDEQDPKTRSMQQIQFLKNLGLIGGLLILLSKGRR